MKESHCRKVTNQKIEDNILLESNILSVKAELNCKITGMISFENDIDMNVKIHSFYVGRTDDCGS